MRARKRFNSEELERARLAVVEINPDDDDATLAPILAERCVAGHTPPYYLAILHDVRRNAPATIACPIRYDWQYKNKVGIKELDREVAKQWAVGAMLLGYAVYAMWKVHGSAIGPGTIAQVRERVRDGRKEEKKVP